MKTLRLRLSDPLLPYDHLQKDRIADTGVVLRKKLALRNEQSSRLSMCRDDNDLIAPHERAPRAPYQISVHLPSNIGNVYSLQRWEARSCNDAHEFVGNYVHCPSSPHRTTPCVARCVAVVVHQTIHPRNKKNANLQYRRVPADHQKHSRKRPRDRYCQVQRHTEY